MTNELEAEHVNELVTVLAAYVTPVAEQQISIIFISAKTDGVARNIMRILKLGFTKEHKISPF